MKIDLYTKTILTVIAIALSAIAFQNVNFVSTAKANTTVTTQTPPPTAIKNETVDVNISHIGGVPLINMNRNEFSISNGLPVSISKNWDK